jgi:hypothetical protein
MRIIPCHGSVSSRRSSNRTCGFPASGFPTGFIAGIRRAVDTSVIHVPTSPWRRDTARSESSGSRTVLHRLAPSHRPSPSSTSAPEVRGLPSAGVTRVQRYCAPVRLPPDPPPQATVKPRPPIERVSPVTRITFPACRAHYPGGSEGCVCRFLPHPCSLPRFAGGSASASLLSRPAQTSLALRPVGLLNRPRRPSSRGFDPASYPTKPLVSYQSNRQLSGWNLPPLVIRALGAHYKTRTF